MLRSVAIAAALLGTSNASTAAERFVIVVQRAGTEGGLRVGQLSVNGVVVGSCYENEQEKIPSGKYKGALRYTSDGNRVQGPGGVLGRTGDFLVEVTGVAGRTDILFHAGNQPGHSKGCLLGGPATTDPETGEKLAPEPLRRMRLMFYGTDQPNSSPNKEIVIEIRDPK